MHTQAHPIAHKLNEIFEFVSKLVCVRMVVRFIRSQKKSQKMLQQPFSLQISGGFPMKIKSKIRYHIICWYHNFMR